MRAAWEAYPESDGYWPDWAKLKRNGVGRLYVLSRTVKDGFVVINDRQVNRAYREAVNTNLGVYGIAYDPSWENVNDPALIAEIAHEDIIRAEAGNAVCPYMFDIESHDAHLVAETIRLWRKLHPNRLTAWTLEPFQGGRFTRELIDRINGDPNLVVLPQNYYGGMQPADLPEAKKLRQDLISVGVQPWRVKVFYDGARRPPYWDGCIFSEERLALHLRRLQLATSA